MHALVTHHRVHALDKANGGLFRLACDADGIGGIFHGLGLVLEHSLP